jgi:hypothetical protein
MPAHIPRLVAIATAFVAVQPVSAANPTQRPVLPRAATSTNSPAAKPFTKSTIAARLGMPSDVLAPGIWVYREVHTDYRQANARGCDTLVVLFAGDDVKEMRMVNGDQLTALLNANRADTSAPARSAEE